jgi:hypothetical protein
VEHVGPTGYLRIEGRSRAPWRILIICIGLLSGS